MPMTFGADQALLPSAPFKPDPPLLAPDEQRSLATAIAERAVVADIESEGVRVHLDGRTWWDTRPMTDPREHAPEVIGMADEAIRYAVGSGLASVHSNQPYLLTFERQA